MIKEELFLAPTSTSCFEGPVEVAFKGGFAKQEKEQQHNSTLMSRFREHTAVRIKDR